MDCRKKVLADPDLKKVSAFGLGWEKIEEIENGRV